MNLLDSLNEAKKRAEVAVVKHNCSQCRKTGEEVEDGLYEEFHCEVLNYLRSGRDYLKSQVAEAVIEKESNVPNSPDEFDEWLQNLSEFRRIGRLLATEVPEWIHAAGICSLILDEQLTAKEITPAQFASGQKFITDMLQIPTETYDEIVNVLYPKLTKQYIYQVLNI